jgi:hypothetical protein
MIDSPAGPEALIDEESLVDDGALSTMSLAFIVGGGVCCCLIVATIVFLVLRARRGDDGSNSYRPPSTLYDMHGDSNDVPYAGSLPQVDSYQPTPVGGSETPDYAQLSLASESNGLARGIAEQNSYTMGNNNNDGGGAGFQTASFDGTAGFYRSANVTPHAVNGEYRKWGGSGADNSSQANEYQDLQTMSSGVSGVAAPRPPTGMYNSPPTPPTGDAGYDELKVGPYQPGSSAPPYSNVPRSPPGSKGI